MILIRPFDVIETAPRCPRCQFRYFALLDEGDPLFIRVDCWCGRIGRCRRDDPDLVRLRARRSLA